MILASSFPASDDSRTTRSNSPHARITRARTELGKGTEEDDGAGKPDCSEEKSSRSPRNNR
jgi:hypothetical protein